MENPLRTFFMEDWLEQNRFHAKFNFGESGGRPRTVFDLLTKSGVSAEEAAEKLLATKLCDSPNMGEEKLREIVGGFHSNASPQNVLITTGTSEALFLLFRYLRPKKVALATPAFQLLYEVPLALSAECVALPVRYDADAKPFVDEKEWFEILETKKPDCVVLNNPHNPSGLLLAPNFLSKVTDIALAMGATVIGDEHYRFLCEGNSLLGPTVYCSHPRVFITGSYIKCFGAPGLRVGWCVGDEKVLCQLQNEKNYLTHTVNPLSQLISVMVLKNTSSMLFKETKQEWEECRTVLSAFLKESQTVEGFVPQGGLVTSLRFRNKHISSSKAFENLRNAGVFVLPASAMEFSRWNPATSFGDENGFRLGLGALPSTLKLGLQQIECTLLELS